MSRAQLGIIVLAIGLTAHAAAQRAHTRNEGGLRMSALSAPKPTYPSALLEQKLSGVAVAAVLVDATGKPETVVVLEAPDPLMAESVRDAVRQWTLRPPLDEDGRSPPS
jgi:TonB family protein